jgi:pilus assembly protein FimV
LLAAVSLSLFVSSAQALSLGDVEVQSKLNEPLVAQIEVLSATAAEIGSLRVGLAGEQDWQRAGLTPQGSAANIRFGFIATGNGNLAVTLRTDESIKEPLLVFLLDAAWSSGHLLREYTIFLDPASLTVKQPAPVQTPVIETSAAIQPARPTAQPISVPEPGKPGLASSYGPVNRGQSLSLIAEELIDGTGLKRHQMMWALFQLNADAFADGNINLLNVGATLALPNYDEVAAVPPQAATSLVRNAAAQTTVKPAESEPSDTVESADGLEAEAATSDRQLDSVAAEGERPVTGAAANDATSAQAGSAQAESAEQGTATAATESAASADRSQVDKLELLPLEPAPESESVSEEPSSGSEPEAAVSTSAQSPQADVAGSGSDTNAGNRRERALAAENELLRERINETEALLKEIRGLLAARSEQLADLQQRLESVERKASSSESVAATQTPQAIGWFWWLLLALALLILLLLVLLLVLLTRKDKQTVEPSVLPTRYSADREQEEDVVASAGDDDDRQVVPVERKKPAQPIFSSAPPPAVADSAGDADEAGEDSSSENFAGEGYSDEADAPVIVTSADGRQEQAEPQAEAGAANLTPADSVPDLDGTDLEERREQVDDTPLEFDIESYVAETSAPEPEVGASSLASEAADVDDELLSDIVLPDPEPEAALELDETALDLTADSGLDADSAAELLAAEVTLDEATLDEATLEPSLNEEGLDLPELDAEAAVAEELPEVAVATESDLDTIELDAGLSAPGEDLVTDESIPAIDNAVDVSDFSGGDQVATKLDLARVYADMGDAQEARSILAEVLRDGDDTQQREAQTIIDSLS